MPSEQDAMLAYGIMYGHTAKLRQPQPGGAVDIPSCPITYSASWLRVSNGFEE